MKAPSFSIFLILHTDGWQIKCPYWYLFFLNLISANDMSASDLRRRQTEAEKNVNRLRNCMPEKLMTFCKMHLSFLLELDGSKLEEMFLDSPNSDAVNKKKTATPFSTKKKGIFSHVIFKISVVYHRNW